MACKSKEKEPVWAKYIAEDNLPTEDLQFLCSIIGLEALTFLKKVSKKLFVNWLYIKFFKFYVLF